MGRPSIDPELMIRMMVVGYVFAIRSERSICREVQVNLAYRRLGIEDAIPDHSAFSRARNERFREGVSRKQAISDIVRVASRIASTIALDLAPGAADVHADGASLFALRATQLPRPTERA